LYVTEYKNKTYLVEPDEVMASTKQYKLENDFYTEYIMDKIRVTNNPKDKISVTAIYENFRDWYKRGYESRGVPKRPEFIKFITKQFGEPNKNSQYTNVVFNIIEESDDDSGPKNVLDI
jgi:hypothetical protein